MAMNPSRNDRDQRIAEIDADLKPVRERLHALSRERADLVTANAREDWPAGPFTLHYLRYGGRGTNDYDTPLEAVHAAIGFEDHGEASTEKITDRGGQIIYDLSGVGPWRRVVDGYPDLPDDDG